MSDFLKSKIRSVTDADRMLLPRYSYSGLSSLKQCPYQFNLIYNEGKRSSDTTLALQLGTLLHYILELKGHMLRDDKKVDYGVLSNVLQNGAKAEGDKSNEEILGLKELKKKYWETWGIPDSEGRTYEQKIELFLRVLSSEMEDDVWEPFQFEYPFEYVYGEKIILHGFIDRVDKRENLFRVVDYKTNKKPYKPTELATSLQFGIYALGILNEFGVVPEEYMYRLILLDEKQQALTLGWQKRLITALDKLVDELDKCKASDEWVPKPTPLCHWCNYCSTNSDAKQYKDECPYHSLWTPENKTFEVNVKYGDTTLDNSKSKNVVDKTPRHVVF